MISKWFGCDLNPSHRIMQQNSLTNLAMGDCWSLNYFSSTVYLQSTFVHECVYLFRCLCVCLYMSVCTHMLKLIHACIYSPWEISVNTRYAWDVSCLLPLLSSCGCGTLSTDTPNLLSCGSLPDRLTNRFDPVSFSDSEILSY